jgi:hypothetical protein
MSTDVSEEPSTFSVEEVRQETSMKEGTKHSKYDIFLFGLFL